MQPQKFGPYKIIDIPTLITYKLEDFSCKQTTEVRLYLINLKNFSFQNKWEKNFSDNSLLRLYPKKPTITRLKSVSFSIDNPDIPSNNEPPPATL